MKLRLKNLHVGDAITCVEKVGVYSYTHTFQPGMVATIATIDTASPAHIIVDFYQKWWETSTLFRSCLRLDNIAIIPEAQAKTYLWEHAPTWEEHLTGLVRFYQHSLAITSSAYRELLPFLLTYPTQAACRAFLEGFALRYPHAAHHLRPEVEMLVLTSTCLAPYRVPWAYRVAGMTTIAEG